MLILRVFPFGSYALLEEMVIGFDCKIGDGCNVVLGYVSGGTERSL
jgi:hypothetical protein